MPAPESDIAVIVVNYGTADLAIEAVESVLVRRHGGRAVEVHLVDNASPGGDAERLAEAHAARGWGARVTLWPETENHGFGRGNNVVLEALAVRAAAPDYVFLLNPDARLETDTIGQLADMLDAHPRAGAAGAAMRGADGVSIAAAFRFPTGAREVIRMINLNLLYRLVPDSRIALPADASQERADWVTGAAVMFRLAALAETGFFDPGFFLYYEEVELMHRLTRAGWGVEHVPSAIVRHDEGAATKVTGLSQDRPAYVYHSFRRYHELTAGRGVALATSLAMAAAALFNILQRRLRGRPPTIPHHFLRDHWRFVLKPLLISSGRP